MAQVSRVPINGVEIQIERGGAGVPFVWGHGLMSSMAFEDVSGLLRWPQLADLADLVRYDARGHGLSGGRDLPGDYTWPLLAQDMLALADSAGFARFVAGGLSMGSATALYAALAAPQRVRALVLVTPPTAWETRAAQGAMYEQMAAAVDAHGAASLAPMSGQMLPPLMQQAAPDLLPYMADLVPTLDGPLLSAVLRGAGQTDLPPREQIRQIAAPTLILGWEGDRGHPVATAQALHDLLPDSQLFIAATVGDVAAWPQRICDFLARVAALGS